MASFGNVGHVLTNAARAASQNTSHMECISVANNTYLYQFQSGTNGGDNIAYNASTNTWDPNPSTNGNYDPSLFMSGTAQGDPTVTPTNSDTTLHVGYSGNAGNIWMISFSVTYSTSPTITISNTGRNITAQISNVTTSTTYNLTDNSSNVVGNGPLALGGTNPTSGTIIYQAPVNITSGAHVYAVRTGNPSSPGSLTLVTSQSLSGLNPIWNESWTLTNATLEAEMTTTQANPSSGLHPGDVMTIKDINNNSNHIGTYTLGVGYNVQNLPIQINGTISLTQSATYGLYITKDNISALIHSAGYPYTAPASPPSIATTVANWSQSGATVTIPVTVSNFGANDKAELWVGGVYDSHITQSGDLTYNFTQTTGSTVFEVKYNNGTTVSSLNPIKQNSYSYTVPVYSISNPVWQPQNGNVISVNWSETNAPPATAVELWKTNGSSAISSSTAGGPLTHTLQSTNDTGTYELRYNGNVVANSTSGTFTYQSSAYMTWGTPNWTVTGYNTAATIECTFTYVNVGIGGGSTAQASFRYNLLNSGVWLYAPYPSTGNVITTPGSGTITLSWTNVQNGDIFQLDQAGLTVPISQHTVANLTSAPPPPQQPSVSYAPAKGGRKRRFPIISTQLFNRQRSVYSIGTTHHEISPQF